jgi:hypothetical protein
MSDHHEDHHQAIDTTGLLQEADDQMPLKIREIDLIKHNPKLFASHPYDFGDTLSILGGFKFTLCAVGGAAFSYWYY